MLSSRELYDRLCTLFPLRWWSDDPWTVMYQSVLVQHTAWSNVEKTSASADLSFSAVSAMSDEELERLGFAFSSDSQRLEYLEKGLDGDVSVFGYYHWLILELCKAWCRKKPLCSSCPLRPDCRRGSSEQASTVSHG